MAFEDSLRDLADPEKRLTSQQLISFGGLAREEVAEFARAWAEVDAARRASVLAGLTGLIEDNVELNFDAVFRLGLDDDDAGVRIAALQGLFEYEEADIIPRLTAILREDSNAEVRRESAVALGRYALAAEFGRLVEADARIVQEVLTEAIEDLEEDEMVRARAIEALGAISGEETQNLIESIYTEGDSLWLRVGAVDAMGRSCDDVWLAIVIREMQSPSPQMRHAAAFAAGSIGENEAIGPLFDMARYDPEPDMQKAAVAALGEIGGDMAKVVLKNLLYEGDDDLREDIQEALSAIELGDDPLKL